MEAIAAEFEVRGYQCDRNIGASHFRCDIAVRRDGDAQYRLGILVDTDRYYANDNLLERDLFLPDLLRAFGWPVARVWTKEWLEDREAVLSRLLDRAE